MFPHLPFLESALGNGESLRDTRTGNGADAGVARGSGSIELVLTHEIRDLIRRSEVQLLEVEHMDIENEMTTTATTSAAMMMHHEGREVVCAFDDSIAMTEDRVSELRFTDLIRDLGGGFVGDQQNLHNNQQHQHCQSRLTDSTDSTNYSRTSLMNASVMTIPTDDMSVQERQSTVLGESA